MIIAPWILYWLTHFIIGEIICVKTVRKYYEDYYGEKSFFMFLNIVNLVIVSLLTLVASSAVDGSLFADGVPISGGWTAFMLGEIVFLGTIIAIIFFKVAVYTLFIKEYDEERPEEKDTDEEEE